MIVLDLEVSADLLTPVSAYLKISEQSEYSFLFESVEGGANVGRFSFLGANPVITRRNFEDQDPLKELEKELDKIKLVNGNQHRFNGGAIGYFGFECVHHFEPKTKRNDLKDIIGVPDAIYMLFDIIVQFDHLHKIILIIGNLKFDRSQMDQLKPSYESLKLKMHQLKDKLESTNIPLPVQVPVTCHYEAESNVGQVGYEGHVKFLKQHIVNGDVIQVVPSQRLKRRTELHPFNIYRQLRAVNPSPYMFYMQMKDFQIAGTSPEMLCKVQNGVVTTHPIAGTRKRGKTHVEDEQLSQDLLADIKERSEHVMLVDLGRNDINRVCSGCSVDQFMEVEKYRHVMHLVSKVSGKLRPECSRFDALRSIFPAGTVSGAPKIKAIELIGDCEQEKRGIYAGAIGHFGYDDSLDTAIAIRTVVVKDGYAYLQAGGGIVYDSEATFEYEETINKLKSVVTAIDEAENKYMK